MLNEWLLTLAEWLDRTSWSTDIHESYYLYAWIESTHVLTITIFLGMLFIIDFRMLGLAFRNVPANIIADRLDKPMMIGFSVMIISGLLLYYAIPVRTTQSIWFRMKVILLIAAAINAFTFRAKMRQSADTWSTQAVAPKRIRNGAVFSLVFWAGVVMTGRAIAYDWFDCHKELSSFMYWSAGCVYELQAQETGAL